jgi:hypothetical protein
LTWTKSELAQYKAKHIAKFYDSFWKERAEAYELGAEHGQEELLQSPKSMGKFQLIRDKLAATDY